MRTLICLLIVGILSGCSLLHPAPQFVYRTQLVVPTDDMLIDCPIQPPPDKTFYMQLSDKEREHVLSQKIDDIYVDSFSCNKRWAALRKWKDDQTEYFKQQDEKNTKGN